MRYQYTPNDLARFWPKVDKSGDCWEWTAARYTTGYAAFAMEGKQGLAHRASYEINIGSIPDGMMVLHRCDNRACVNPAHLFLGTHADNMRDRNAKGRQSRGEKSRPKNPARGLRNGKYTKPERTPRGERNGHYTKPERMPRGETHGMSKVTAEQVLEIRAHPEIKPGVFAEKFGILPSTVWRIRTYRAWKHLP